jgi:hypothetical protein
MPATPSVFVPDYSDLIVQLMTETQDEYAVLKTLHGPFGKWEHYRVVLKESLVLEHRTRPPCAGATTWTDKLLIAAAHNDPRYRSFLDQGSAQGVKFNHLAELRGEQAAEVARQGFGGVR